MQSITLKLDDERANFIAERARINGFPSSEDCLIDWIDAERDRDHVRNLLIEGIKSGRPIELDTSRWIDLGALLDQERLRWNAEAAPGSAKP
ncbi:hypothetical protein [Roseateles chitinivorans]|uniref:hypothetical protein n=1 Tax=Roseateles chitinivorans TaxID=2917965 RepID=UPI003D66F7DA